MITHSGTPDTVIVTGAAGFIGATLVHKLSEAGAQVHALVHPRTNKRRLSELSDTAHIHLIDLVDADSLLSIVTHVDPDSVIHAAARGGHPVTSADCLAMWRDNVLGTATLLEALTGVPLRRFVHIGSSLEYAPSDRPLAEDALCAPTTVRGASKLAATGAVRQWAQQHAVPWVVVRPFCVYGPKEQPDRLIPTLIRCLRTGETFRLLDKISRRDFIHIDDVTDACLACLRDPNAIGNVLNLGTGIEHSVDEVVTLVEHLSGQTISVDPGSLPAAVHDVPHWAADMSHTLDVLRWKPAIDLDHGLSTLIY